MGTGLGIDLKDTFIILGTGAGFVALIIIAILMLKAYNEYNHYRDRTGKDDN